MVVRKGVELRQMVIQIVRLLVFRFGDVRGQYRSGFKSDIDHHLEHVDSVILDALTSEVGSFLIVVHGHVTA